MRRIDPATGLVTAFAAIEQPYGIDVAADGTVSVVEGSQNRVVRLSPTGARLGFVGPAFAVPYDVEVARRRDLRPGRGAGGLHPPHRAGRNRDDGLAPLIASW